MTYHRSARIVVYSGIGIDYVGLAVIALYVRQEIGGIDPTGAAEPALIFSIVQGLRVSFPKPEASSAI